MNDASSAVLVERDEPTAEAVAADLRTALGREIDLELVVTDDPASVIEASAGERVLFSPRVWSELDDDARSNERCAVVRYQFDRTELEAAAREIGWQPAQMQLERSR